ncbi:MAG: TIGR00730 family Rossman fold protein [Deltaproteobacteria bacterium]|jgi:uncharacterized protein (TIGR00730 family)
MELHFTRTNGPVDDSIDQLMDLVGGIQQPAIVREMILAALKAGQENVERVDLKLMNSTLKEMRFTSKVFGPYHSVRKVTVFGSARAGADETVYEMAKELGRKLAESGYMVITGGGPGIMQAVNEGAGPDHSFGVNIRLPFEQKANPVIDGNPRSINYKYFFNRKVAFLKESDAVALFPGGFGTLDEAMETLTLVQTGKRAPLPLILLDSPGGKYWARWVDFLKKELLSREYISAMDFDLFEVVDSADAALERIGRFYHRYHSLRYVGDQLVIRLRSEIQEEDAAALKQRFIDMLRPGGDLHLSRPFPEEADEPEVARLPRLVVDFNRQDFGRLHKLIEAINSV